MSIADAPSGRSSAVTRSVPWVEILRLVVLAVVSAWLIASSLRSERPVVGAFVAAGTATMLWCSRRWPLPALAAAYALIPALTRLAGYPGPDDVLVLTIALANFFFGRNAPLSRQPWAIAGTTLFVAVVVQSNIGALRITDMIFPAILTLGPWLFGLTLQVLDERTRAAELRADESQRRRIADLESARREERAAIARELHDVVAHGVSVVSLHAQLARRRLEAGETVSVADLKRIEDASRDAMGDLRSLLDVMRPGTGTPAPLEPNPGIEDLAGLVATCRASGRDCRVTIAGPPRELPEALSLTAFRIIQEAVTNAMRHGAPGTPIEVRLDWHPGGLAAEVVNQTAPTAVDDGVRPTLAGHGLVGIAERVALYGGDAVSGPTADGTWRVRAQLPLPQDAAVV